jgi:hypothetical protein
MKERKFYVRRTIFISAVFCISFLTFWGSIFTSIGHEKSDVPKEVIIIAFFTMIFSGIAAFSNLILGWRNDVRNNTETKLKIEKLELEIAELRKNKEEEGKSKIITY